MPTSTSDPRRTRRTALLVPALAVVLAVAGYLAHPSLRLASSEAAGQSPGAESASALSGGVPAAAAPPAGALTVGTAVDESASPEAVAAALYDAYAAATQVVPASCHLPVSLLAAVGQAESGALVDVAAGRAALTAVAARTARSLCAGDRDLARPGDLRAALLERVASPEFVRLVLTLEARYSGMGLGLLAVTGPVLVPMLVAAATARPMAPYAPVAAVFSSLGPRPFGARAPSARPHQEPPLVPASASPTPALTVATASKSPSLTPGVIEPTPAAPAEPAPAEPAAPASPDAVDTPTSDPTPVCQQDPVTDPSPSPSDPASSDPAPLTPDPGTGTDPAAGDCADPATGGSAGTTEDPAEMPTEEPDPVTPPPETLLP